VLTVFCSGAYPLSSTHGPRPQVAGREVKRVSLRSSGHIDIIVKNLRFSGIGASWAPCQRGGRCAATGPKDDSGHGMRQSREGRRSGVSIIDTDQAHAARQGTSPFGLHNSSSQSGLVPLSTTNACSSVRRRVQTTPVQTHEPRESSKVNRGDSREDCGNGGVGGHEAIVGTSRGGLSCCRRCYCGHTAGRLRLMVLRQRWRWRRTGSL